MVNYGIVGTGLIANDIAKVIVSSNKINLHTVSSRKLASAEKFSQNHSHHNNSKINAIEGINALLCNPEIHIVYLAIPTTFKFDLGLKVLNAGKHLLIDKPMPSEAKIHKLINLAKKNNLVIMDATHFVHHPRTEKIKQDIIHKLGKVTTLHSSFYFPISDANNIRLNSDQEPMTGIGDLGWYNMRAIVEYLQPEGETNQVTISTERHPEPNAIVRASGLINFSDNKCSTFQMGYNANAVQMDLSIVGTHGMITLNDFVLDWHNSHVFNHPEIEVGYNIRSDIQTQNDFDWVGFDKNICSQQLMVEKMAELVTNPNPTELDSYNNKTLMTQRYVDSLWRAVKQ